MEKRKVKIYYTSDVHGYFYPTSYGDREVKPMGLFACASEYKKDDDTLVIDGGDMLQGSAYAYYSRNILGSCEYIAQMANDCGYDFYTLGNHDFNYGQEYQAIYRNNHKGTCVCENVLDSEGNILYPHMIHMMKNGVKVGLVGIVTDYINVWEKKENLVGIQVVDPFEAAKKALEDLQGKVDLTICIYHGGFESDLETGKRLSGTTENIGYKICTELGFDVLLTGHQHMPVAGRMVNGTYTLQPLANGREYAYLEIDLEKEAFSSGNATYPATITSINSKKVQPNPDNAKELCEKYSFVEAKVQEWLDEPLGHLSRPLYPEDKVKMALEGSGIADLINRIQLDVSGAQLSIVGLANDIVGFNACVTTRDIIATYPFPNTLVVCRITGEKLRAAMERAAEYFETDENGKVVVAKSFLSPKVEHYNYDYFAGVTWEIHPEAPMGSRIQNLCYQGKPVQPDDEFTLCMNNYRYSGAGGYPMYPTCPLVKEINTEMVEIIMDYFRTHGTVAIDSEKN